MTPEQQLSQPATKKVDITPLVAVDLTIISPGHIEPSTYKYMYTEVRKIGLSFQLVSSAFALSSAIVNAGFWEDIQAIVTD